MVRKMINRSRKIREIGDEGLFLNIESPVLDSCRNFEVSMVMCLLESLVKCCGETLAAAGELIVSERSFS